MSCGGMGAITSVFSCTTATLRCSKIQELSWHGKEFFFPFQIYDISEHVLIKLHTNYHDFVLGWVRPEQKPGWEGLCWEVLFMSCDKWTIQQIWR